MENKKLITILITGANKGIGFGIIDSLINSQVISKNWKYKIILTSRNEKRGKKALENLHEKYGELREFLFYKNLDITEENSIKDIIYYLKLEFGKIDILVNNAGIAFKGEAFNTEIFDTTFATNFYATVNLTEKFLENKIINDKGKIIIIGSAFGNLKKLGNILLKEFQKKEIEIEDLFSLAKRFRNSIEKGKCLEEGWIENTYKVSKMFINKYAQILGKREEIYHNKIQIYSCCPDWVKTDMGGQNAYRRIEEGVMCPISLIELKH